MTAQSFRACLRGQSRPHPLEQNPPRVIEIVKVMVVTEQYGIDAAEGLRTECGTYSFPQRIHGRWILFARRIKRRIGKQPQSAQFQ
jgi:hypothetical protein